MAELKNKQFVFSFVGGGWNSVWAKTKRGAIASAKKEYKYSLTLIPDYNSFRVTTTEQYNSLLAMTT